MPFSQLIKYKLILEDSERACLLLSNLNAPWQLIGLLFAGEKISHVAFESRNTRQVDPGLNAPHLCVCVCACAGVCGQPSVERRGAAVSVALPELACGVRLQPCKTPRLLGTEQCCWCAIAGSLCDEKWKHFKNSRNVLLGVHSSSCAGFAPALDLRRRFPRPALGGLHPRPPALVLPAGDRDRGLLSTEAHSPRPAPPLCPGSEQSWATRVQKPGRPSPPSPGLPEKPLTSSSIWHVRFGFSVKLKASKAIARPKPDGRPNLCHDASPGLQPSRPS